MSKRVSCKGVLYKSSQKRGSIRVRGSIRFFKYVWFGFCVFKRFFQNSKQAEALQNLSAFEKTCKIQARVVRCYVKQHFQAVLCLVKKDGLALEWAAEHFKADRDLVLAAVRKGAFALEHAAVSLKEDRNFVLQAVRCNGYALAKCEKFQGDREIVEAAILEDPSALEYASDALRQDKGLALLAARDDTALQHIHEKLWEDRTFLREILQKNEAALDFVPRERTDKREMIVFFLDLLPLNPKLLPRMCNVDLFVSGKKGERKNPEATNGDASFLHLQDFLVEALLRNPLCFHELKHLEFEELKQFEQFHFERDLLLRALRARVRRNGRNEKSKKSKAENSSETTEQTEFLCELLKEVPPEFWDESFVCSAVEISPETFRCAPAEFQMNRELLRKMVCLPGLASAPSESLAARSLLHAHVELRGDRDFLLSLIEKNPSSLRFSSEELHLDHDFNLASIRRNQLVCKYVRNELWQDKAFILKAIDMENSEDCLGSFDEGDEKDDIFGDIGSEERERCGLSALNFVAAPLLCDWKFAFELVEKRGFALKFLSEELRSNRSLVQLAIEDLGLAAIRWASESLQNDKRLLRQALKTEAKQTRHYGRRASSSTSMSSSFSFAGFQCKDDAELVLEATKVSPDAFRFASERLRKNADLVWEALRSSSSAESVLQHSPLKSDPHFVLSASIHYEASIQYADEADERI